MFKVQAHSLEYFDADPARKANLQALDTLIRAAVVSSSAAA